MTKEECEERGIGPDYTPDLPPPQEWFFGEWVGVAEFVERLNQAIQPSRAAFIISEHEDNILSLDIEFEN